MTNRRRIKSMLNRWGIERDEDEIHDRLRNSFKSGLALYGVADEFTNSRRLDFTLAQLLGVATPDVGSEFLGAPNASFERTNLRFAIVKSDSLTRLVEIMQGVLWATESLSADAQESARWAVEQALDYTPEADLRLAWNGTAATIVPAGARLLDRDLVDEVLGWLEDFPTARGHYKNSLTHLASGDPSRLRNGVDELRRAVEALLRKLLGQRKGLQKLSDKRVLGPWLKDRGVEVEVRKLVDDVLRRFRDYQNEHAKHGDNVDELHAETMLYLTGVVMRTLMRAQEQAAKLDMLAAERSTSSS